MKDITPIYFILVILNLEADNLIDNIICQDILINVIFGCESELWRLQFGQRHIRLPSVLVYIFEILVLIEIMVKYLCSMYSDFTCTLRVHPSTFSI